MSRYIDADAFLKEYCEPYPHVYMAMQEAPSIDIVRCKECVHKGVDADDEPYCELHNMGIYADDYCSYGEREGE